VDDLNHEITGKSANRVGSRGHRSYLSLLLVAFLHSLTCIWAYRLHRVPAAKGALVWIVVIVQSSRKIIQRLKKFCFLLMSDPAVKLSVDDHWRPITDTDSVCTVLMTMPFSGAYDTLPYYSVTYQAVRTAAQTQTGLLTYFLHLQSGYSPCINIRTGYHVGCHQRRLTAEEICRHRQQTENNGKN